MRVELICGKEKQDGAGKSMNLSLILMTRDNKKALYNKLKYYNRFNVDVLVADSSESEYDKSELEALCRRVRYYHYSHDCPVLEKIKETLKKVQTDYFMYVPDDDYFCIEGVKECVSFLEENRDYSAAQGKWIGFCDEIKGKYAEVYRQPNQQREESTALDRFVGYWNNPSQWFYCVARTNQIRANYAKMGTDCKELALCEPFVASVVVITGMTKVLDVPFGVSKIHSQLTYKRAKDVHKESVRGRNDSWNTLQSSFTNLIASESDLEYDYISDTVGKSFLRYSYVPTGLENIIPWIKGYFKKLPVVRNYVVHEYFWKSNFKSNTRFPFNESVLEPIERAINDIN